MIDSQKKELDKDLKLMFKSSLVVFIGLVLSKILAYVYRIAIARHYGPEIYGLFSLATMVLGWFSIFSGLGLNMGLVRFIPFYRGRKDNEKISYLFKTSLTILWTTSVLAGIFLFFFSEYISLSLFSNKNLIIFLKLFSFAIPLIIIGGIFLTGLRSYEKIGWNSFISNILGNLTKVALIFVLIYFGFNSSAIAVSFLAGAFAVFFGGYLVLKIQVPEIFKSKSRRTNFKGKKIFGEMFSYSWPLIFFGMAASIFHWTDTFILGIFEGVEQVGFYNAAVPIAVLLTLSSDLFRQLFFPLVNREYAIGNLEVVKQLSKQISKWIFIIVFPFFVLLILFPGASINLLFGSEYLVARNALRFLAIGSLFTTIFLVSRDLLSMKGKSRLILFDILIIGGINLLLNLIFIPKYGISGAGFSTMISMILLNLTFLFQTHHYLSIIPLRKKMIKIVAITFVSATALFLFNDFLRGGLSQTIVLLFLFFLLYLFLILVSNSLDKNDLMILNLIKTRFLKHKKL